MSQLPVTGQKQWADTLNDYLVGAQGALLEETEDARDGAVAALTAAQALVISDLGTTDGQTRALVEAPASQTAIALAASISSPSAPVARANGAASNPLVGGGTSPGKRVLGGRATTGELVLEVGTEQIPNGYTVLDLFPSTESSRSAISVWAKSPDDLEPAELNARLWSMQGHSVAEEGISHCTMYAQMKQGMTTQNARKTISAGGPLESYQGHIFQFATEDQFDNRFELLTFLQARGLMAIDLWDNAAGAYAGLSDEAGTYPTFMLASGTENHVALIQQRNGLLQLATGTGGAMKLTTPGGISLSGSQVFVDDTTTGMRIRGPLAAVTETAAGVYIGRNAGDQSQPTLRLTNGTAGQEVLIDNRLGVLRLAVGSVARIQANTGGLAFNGSTPIVKPVTGPVATDLATAIARVNAIATGLINYGLMSLS